MELPEMQQFAVDFSAKMNRGIRPGELSRVWREHKGQNRGVASRDQFGATAAAYKCLRTLAEKGLLIKKDEGRSWSDEVFYPLNSAQ